jgi:RNA polymerase sigma-70 factor (ECF subfamily)
LGAPAGAADIEQGFQDLCLKLCEDGYRRLGTYRGKSRLASWAAVVAIRLAREASARQRDLRSAERARPAVLQIEDPLLAGAEKEALLKAMEALPIRERLVLRLIYWDRATLAEASAVLGIPANTLSPMLTSIREKLRNLLSK